MHAHDAARRTPARPGGRPVASGRPGRWLACALLLACGCPCAALAADGASCAPRDGDATRPSVGLALGGGGARGVAHISVLRKLEAMGVPVDCIAGTSMGSLVGGLYASGVPVDELEQMVLETDWKQIFDDSIDRRDRSFRRKQDDRDGVATIGIGVRRDKISISPGVLQGERILSLFERRTLHVSAIDDFDRLPIPFRAIATDINTGEPYELSSGSLAAAMRASMSLPGIFQPMNLDGRVLIDGGVAEQVPIDAVRRMGADIVIAVDVGTPLATLGSDAGVLQVVSQLTGLLTVGNTRTSLAKLEAHDVLIVPALGVEVATGDFEKAAEALRIGRVAADDAQAALAALPRYASGRPPPRPERHEPVVEFVRLENESRYADAVLTGIIDVPVGAPVDADALEAATLRAYNLGTFASVTYEVVEEDGRTGVVVHAKEKAQGPNYLQAGFRLETDFSGTYESSLRLALLRAPVTENGAEARVLVGLGSEPGIQGEYYHPFDPGAKHYLYARLGIHGTETPVFDDDGNRIAIYDAVVGNAGLSLGRTFGVFGAAEVGLEYSGGQAEVQVGDPTLPDIDVDSGAWFASLVVDQVDSLHFPRDGYLARMKYRASVDWLGDGEEFEEVGVDALVAYPFGRHALQLGAGYHSTLSGVLPVHERYRVGGRGRLVGFHYNELTGQQFAVVMLGYMYEWGTLMGRSAVLGSTLEYGNAWEDRSDMAWSDGVLNGSVYAGFDSWIGPMLFGYGRREGGEGLVFIEIGKAF